MDNRTFARPGVRAITTVACLLALVLAGYWLRVRHLDRLGLIADEGIQALAVGGILEHGVPKVDSGRIYTRGLPFLYLEAASASLGGLNEFSLRLPAVLFGVFGIVVVYLLGATVFDRRVGLLAALLMACSVWEVELSRYARFYTAFQCCYALSLLFFYRGFMLGHRRDKLWFTTSTVLTIALHELGVMLATCFLIPLFSDAHSRRYKWWCGILAVGMVVLWVVYGKAVDLLDVFADPLAFVRTSGSSVSWLLHLKSAIKGRLFIPNLSAVVGLFREHTAQFVGLAAVPLATSTALLLRAIRRKEAWRAIVALPIIWAAFLHQFGLVLIGWLIYLAFFARDRRSLWEPSLRVVYAAVGACGLFWGLGLATDPAYSYRILRMMFSYPHFYQYFLSWFVRGWPVLTAIVAGGIVWLATRWIAAGHKDPTPLFMIGALLVPAILTSFLQTPFWAARYTFHLYPLMLVIFSAVLVTVGTRVFQMLPWRGSIPKVVLMTSALAAALLISYDGNVVTAWAVSERTHQSSRDLVRGPINSRYYKRLHQDYKTPSLYVRTHRTPDDVVLAIGLPHEVAAFHYYAGKVDYAVEETIRPYQIRLADGKILEHVTGSELLRTVGEVSALVTRDGSRVWLLGRRGALETGTWLYSDELRAHLWVLVQNPDYVGLDGDTVAVRIR